MKKERVREKYWDPMGPKNDLDFVEISVPNDGMDQIINEYAPAYVQSHQNIELRERLQIKKERLLRKIFKAATIVLTDRQLQIFTMRMNFLLKEREIAKQLKVNQSYVSNVLRISSQKIRVALRMEQKKERKKIKK